MSELKQEHTLDKVELSATDRLIKLSGGENSLAQSVSERLKSVLGSEYPFSKETLSPIMEYAECTKKDIENIMKVRGNSLENVDFESVFGAICWNFRLSFSKIIKTGKGIQPSLIQSLREEMIAMKRLPLSYCTLKESDKQEEARLTDYEVALSDKSVRLYAETRLLDILNDFYDK